MKYSGIEWIGNIPDEWQLINLGIALKEYWESNEKIDSHALQFKYGTIIPKKEIELTLENLEMLSKYNKVKKDVIMVNGLNLAFDFITQRVAIVEEDGVITSTYIALKPTNFVIPRFMLYLLKAYDNQKVFHALGRGLRCMLSYETLKREKVLFCDKQKQQMIADRIDFVCEKIEKAIALETQQIEKLKEYKQAVITEAVTKGLDKNAPMKDSGVEWIGKVPVGWSLPSIKMIADTCSGGTPQSGNLEYYDGDINWVCSYDLKESVIEESKIKITKKGASIIAGKMQKPGSVLIAMYGGGGTIGNSGRLNCYARTNQAICSIDFNRDLVLPEYAHYVVKFMRSFWMIYAVGTRKDPNINQVIVDNMPFICPTIDEQRKIIDYLDEKCASIEKLLIIKQQKIEKLNEYKKSLIYEYVTGKKEVI